MAFAVCFVDRFYGTWNLAFFEGGIQEIEENGNEPSVTLCPFVAAESGHSDCLRVETPKF